MLAKVCRIVAGCAGGQNYLTTVNAGVSLIVQIQRSNKNVYHRLLRRFAFHHWAFDDVAGMNIYSDREPSATSWQLTTQTDRAKLARLLAILKPGAPPQAAVAK